MSCLADDGIWSRIGPMARPMDGMSVEDIATYGRLARLAGVLIETCGYKERSWTRFRVASAVMQEVASGRAWSANQRRLACGCHSIDYRERMAGVYEAVLMAAIVRAERCQKGGPVPSPQADLFARA